MLVYLIRRLSQSAFVLVAMAVLVFIGIYAVGNPVDVLINPEADLAERQATIERLGLDRPLYEQFWLFVTKALQGDLGRSFLHAEPALPLILERLPATLELAGVAMLIAVFVGVPLGMIAGLRAGKPAGKTIMAGSILGFSLPNFWQGLMLIMIFAVMLGWLPAGGRGETVEVRRAGRGVAVTADVVPAHVVNDEKDRVGTLVGGGGRTGGPQQGHHEEEGKTPR